MKGFQFPGVNKKELEDQRKKEDEEAAAKAFEEYIEVFQDNPGTKAPNKVWIKAGTYEAGKKHDDSKERGKLYKPTSRFEREPDPAPAPVVEDFRPERLGKKKEKEKRKSNLEIFKDELKLIQEEREERHRLKNVLGLQEVIKLPPKPGDDLRASLSLELDDVRMGSIDDGDPNTTNIYLGNLPTKISEQQLMDLFGKFGPLASVKVMWPRTEEEKSRNRLSGFVAFMSRRDGERALKNLAGKDILGTEVKLGWGKAVPIPSFPIFVPPQMRELTMPPPLSGLPFNAQPDRRDRHRIPPPGTPYPVDPKGVEEFERVLQSATVKVVTPTDRGLISLIHRMVEFVAREGPMFEAMVMNREMGNPAYRFLFENQSPAHIYYRWKLFSILQGESVQRWRIEEFRMFKGGSVWRPPTLNPFTQGMPEELIPEEDRDSKKGTLSNAQRDRLERMLRAITPERYKIAEVMIFSIEHAESADEICITVKESLTNPKTALPKKIARLYVISDILHNCTARGMNASSYRKCFQAHLPSVFQETHYAHQTACSEGVGSSAESFKQRVLACFRAWEEWGIYPNEFLIRLQNIFLGLITVNSREDEAKVLEGVEAEDDELIKKRRKSPPRAQMPPKSALNLVRAMQSTEPGVSELDGTPLDELDGTQMEEEEPAPEPKVPVQPQENNVNSEVNNKPKGGFLPSKWETIDPEEVKAQAVTTTSKWDLFEEGSSNHSDGKDATAESSRDSVPGVYGLVADYDEDLDGEPMEDEKEENGKGVFSLGKVGVEIYEDENTEERRVKLREIENKVLAFQDELESGRRKLKHGESVHALCQQQREKLLRKSEKERERAIKAEITREREPEIVSEVYSASRSSRKAAPEREPRSDRERYERDREPRSERRESGRGGKESRSRRGRSPSPPNVYDDRDRGRGRSPPASQSRPSEKSSRKHGHSRGDSQSPKRSQYPNRSRSRSPRRSSKYRSRSRSRSPTRRQRNSKY